MARRARAHPRTQSLAPVARARRRARMSRRTRARWTLALVAALACACAPRASHAVGNPFARRSEPARVSEQEVIASALTDEHVVKLDAKAFDGELKKSRYNFVMFYAPWDGHSKAFMPRWLSYARSHQMAGTEMRFGLVDATKEKALDERFDIEEYPTLVLFRDGVPKTYVGDRSPEHLDKFVRRNLLKPARWLEGTDDVEVFLIGRPVTVIGFFDDPADLELFHHAAAEFDLDFGETKSKIASEDWKAPFPSIKMWRDFSKEPVRYEGDYRNLTAIKQWIAAESVPPVVKFSEKVHLDRLFQGPIAANIFVFLPDDASDANLMSVTLEDAARQLWGKVHIITVDAEEKVMHDYFSLHHHSGPQIRLLSHDLKYAYRGSFEADRMASDLVTFFQEFQAKKLVPMLKSQDPLPKDGDILQVVGKTFQSLLLDNDKHVFVWFYAPWCRTCKAMKPVWEKLATLYKDEKSIIIAKMDATKNEAKDVHVRHYPTVYYYHPGDKPRHEEYDGSLDTDSMIEFLRERTGKGPRKARRRSPHVEL